MDQKYDIALISRKAAKARRRKVFVLKGKYPLVNDIACVASQ